MPSLIKTSRWVAAQRALESERSDRLFSDPLARPLAGDEGIYALQMSEKYNPQHENTSRFIVMRVRFFDDVSQDFAVSERIRQIVVLAAGMDSRCYRLPWPDGTTVYELDHPELFSIKEEILKCEAAKPNCRRVTLGVNLEHDWSARLIGTGFNPNERSIWLIEGLFYYLEEAAVDHILSEVSKLASPGSVLITDLVSHSLLTSPWMQSILKVMEERGVGWRFGTDDPVGLFAGYGWNAEVKRPEQEGVKYDPQRFPAAAPGHGKMWGFFVVAQRA